MTPDADASAVPLPPHRSGSEPVAARRGFFWVGTERAEHPAGTVPRGPMYVAWEAPPEVTRPYPMILVHGGGGQGTDWLGTPDDRPGWATHLVSEGYAVYVVDRPGHGRSPHHPEVLGEMGPPFSYEALRDLFVPADDGRHPRAHLHTQWPVPRDADAQRFDQVVDQAAAATGPMLADLAAAQEMEATRLTELLELTGPAVLVTHSAGAPGGWLAADARPDLVRALVALEPMGPPFLERPDRGQLLPWGLTAVPLTCEPAVSEPALLQESAVRLPRLSRVPIVVVTAEASAFDLFGADVVGFLRSGDCEVEQLRLADHGVRGNGHAFMLERNNREALQVVLDWLASGCEVRRQS